MQESIEAPLIEDITEDLKSYDGDQVKELEVSNQLNH